MPANILLISIALLQIFSLAVTETVSGCEPLIYREDQGVRVKCTLAVRNSRSKIINCYARTQKIPPGTVAKYHCDAPFYVPLARELSIGDNHETRLTCSSRGKWIGGFTSFLLYSCKLNCGIPGASLLTSFILRGTVTEQDDWPWHATLFEVLGGTSGAVTKFEYFCGGSLIKPADTCEFVILTAAHCVEQGGHGWTREENEVRVVLGAEVSSLNESRSRSPDGGDVYHVKEIIMHDRYDGDRGELQSDIAIVRLVEPVRLRANVLPVCLSKLTAKPNDGDVGHLAGFGVYEKGSSKNSKLLRRASIPVVDPDLCFKYRQRRLNPQEFCAGTDNQQNACNGDSGGGLVFNATDENGLTRFYLHGIVSHSKGSWNRSHVQCDTYVVFTEVSSFMDWIHEIAETFDDDGKHHTSMPMTATSAAGGERKSGDLQLEPQPPTNNSRQDCGIPKAGFPSPVPGQGTKVLSDTNAWPWHAQILIRRDDVVRYICSGSLVLPPGIGSTLFVVTAAHCMVRSDGTQRWTPTDVLVAFGFTELRLDGMDYQSLQLGQGRVFPVKGIATHKSHNASDGSYKDDIALIRLAESAEQDSDLVPVCLSECHGAPPAGRIGHLLGFGNEGLPFNPSGQLRRLSFPVATADKCGFHGVLFPHLQFCAGVSGFKTVCLGDSGAGLVFDKTDAHHNNNGKKRFYLEGIVSSGEADGTEACEFTVFTKVSSYFEWIMNTAHELLGENPA